MDPYIIVSMGKQVIHRTKPIYKSLNPVWMVGDGFLVFCPPWLESDFPLAD
jgi:hypothetical protein